MHARLSKNAFQNQFMFNIQENENETTNNYDNMDMKVKMQQQTTEGKISRKSTMINKNIHLKRNPNKKISGTRDSITSYDNELS